MRRWKSVSFSFGHFSFWMQSLSIWLNIISKTDGNNFTSAYRNRRADMMPMFYDPCEYPSPSDADEFTLRCGLNYFGSKIFCDPDHMFSRTEADKLAADFRRANVSSCLCEVTPLSLAGDNEQFEQCSELIGAVAFARSASLKRPPPSTSRSRSSSRSLERTNQPNTQCRSSRDKSQSRSHEMTMTKFEQMQNFVEQLVNIWRADAACRVDFLLTVFGRWYPKDDNNSDSDNDAYVVAYVGERVYRRLDLIRAVKNSGNSAVNKNDDDQDNDLQSDSQRSSTSAYTVAGGRSTDVFLILRKLTANYLLPSELPNGGGGETKTVSMSNENSGGAGVRVTGVMVAMPDWAIILFVVCILMLPLCLLIGNIVSVVPARHSTMSTPESPSLRWTQKRWRAGFGGGFFGIRWKKPLTTAGDQSLGGGPIMNNTPNRIKPPPNNMMFRQFSKFKKPPPKASIVSGASEGRAGPSWTYV